MLFAAGQIRFVETKANVDVVRDPSWLVTLSDSPVPVNWDNAQEIGISVADLEKSPEAEGGFAALPAAAGKAKSYDAWGKDFAAWLYRTQKFGLFRSPSLKQASKPGEPERDFRIRLGEAGREQRDLATSQLRKKYAPRLAALEERIRRAEQMKEKQAEQARSQHMQTVISFGATILGAFLGRKTISASTVEKAATAARKVGKSIQETKEVGLAEENVEALRNQLAELEAEFKAETEALAAKIDPLAEPLETIAIHPTKSNITVKLVALAWTPYWTDQQGRTTPAWV
jgi:hypothetical protein